MLEIPQTRLAEQPTQTKTIEPEDIIIIIWDNSKYRAEFCVLCSLKDHDFNRAIYSTT